MFFPPLCYSEHYGFDYMMMIKIKDAIPRNPDFHFRQPISFAIEKDEHIAFVGPNGGGKSAIAQLIAGKYLLREGHIVYDESLLPVYEKIRFISFKDSYGPADSTYYLQQRWNSQDREDSPIVSDVLGDVMSDDLNKSLLSLLDIDKMLDKQIVMLSSGEMRKFQLSKALLTHPYMLIIDNPFIGLDTTARELLCHLLGKLAGMREVQLILLLSKMDEMPDFITHILPVSDMCCEEKIRRVDFRDIIPTKPNIGELLPPETMITESQKESDLPSRTIMGKDESPFLNSISAPVVIEMRNVSIRYGQYTILDSLNWTVRRGEKWALLGRNGSGKSTLLSLVCADNPQGYACDISLFGSRRGSGESIWDIKKRIGYVSPEMHRSYSENIPAIQIVASGLHDSIGLYVRPRPEQFAVCEWWMKLFGILHLKDRMFLQLSDGEQRMVLLARAFVKDPPLLILDEPMHGLDVRNRLLAQAIIEAFCRRLDKTLIMVTHYEHELPKCIDKSLKLNVIYGNART